MLRIWICTELYIKFVSNVAYRIRRQFLNKLYILLCRTANLKTKNSLDSPQPVLILRAYLRLKLDLNFASRILYMDLKKSILHFSPLSFSHLSHLSLVGKRPDTGLPVSIGVGGGGDLNRICYTDFACF
jgi:hypothetical protein